MAKRTFEAVSGFSVRNIPDTLVKDVKRRGEMTSAEIRNLDAKLSEFNEFTSFEAGDIIEESALPPVTNVDRLLEKGVIKVVSKTSKETETRASGEVPTNP